MNALREAARTSSARALLVLAARERRLLVWTVVAGLCYQACSLGSAAAGTWLVGASATGRSAGELAPALWVLGGMVGAAALLRWLQLWIAHDLAFRLIALLRVRLFDGLDRAAPRFLLGRRTGDLASTAMSDAENLQRFFTNILADYIVAILITTVSLVVLAVIDPWLMLAMLPFAVLVATVPFWLGRRAVSQGRQLREELGALNAEVVDGVQGLRELVAFGQGHNYLDRLRRRTRLFQRLQLRYGVRVGAEQAATDALLALGMLAMLIAAAVLIERGALAPLLYPVVVIVGAYSLLPLSAATQNAQELGQIHGSAQRIFSIVHHPPAVVELAAEPPLEPITSRIEFDSVRFRYSADTKEVLKGMSFLIDPGEHVALVGTSGAGKSTCANLLLRFWDPDMGRIELGGHDLRDFPQAELRKRIAYVPQDAYIFNATLRDNIRLGRHDASDDQVEQAARQAQAHGFISELPQGYDTIVGEQGVQLSGGQKQRIAIARALVMEAPILVMDEAVSNLDAVSEWALQAAMREASRGRTTILIAHRLSTILNADRVLMLKDGRVIEQGCHEELIVRGGPYAQLISSQSGGPLGGELEIRDGRRRAEH